MWNLNVRNCQILIRNSQHNLIQLTRSFEKQKFNFHRPPKYFIIKCKKTYFLKLRHTKVRHRIMSLWEDNLADDKNKKKSKIYFFVKTELSHMNVQFVHFYCANVHNGYALDFWSDDLHTFLWTIPLWWVSSMTHSLSCNRSQYGVIKVIYLYISFLLLQISKV